MGKNGIDIFDILLVLAKRKKFIIVAVFLVTVAFIIYSLLATQYWKSSVSFLTISQDRGAVPFSRDLLGGFGSALLGTEIAGNVQIYRNILRSRSFSEEIIRKYDLIEYFKAADPDSLVAMEQAIKQLHEDVLQIVIDPETGMLSLVIETRDRYLSADIANTYFDMLEEYYLTNKMSKGRERRIFLEARVTEFEANFAELSRRMQEFQAENRIIDMQAQTEAIIGLYSEIVAQKMQAEIELDFARKYMAEESQMIVSLTEQLATLNRTIREMERSDPDSRIQPTYIVNIDDIPGLTSRYLQLNLNLEIQRRVIEFLYPQYEQARLDELSDISTFELVDRAIPAGLRSRPRRGRMVITAFIISFLAASLLAYTYEVFTETPRKEKVDSFLKELFKK